MSDYLSFLSSKGVQVLVYEEPFRRGGEGNIHKTNIPNTVAKLYKSLLLASERKTKLEIMIANPPDDPTLVDGHISIAWPKDLLFKVDTNQLVGFLMPEILSEFTLDCICQVGDRKAEELYLNWLDLHFVACNVSAIVMALHDKGYIIGDIKCQNFLVRIIDRDGRVSIVDTDSFQIRDTKTGKIHPCLVESPEFSSPESLQKTIPESIRSLTLEHDQFGLGIILHQLLLGDHPFDGVYVGHEDRPDRTMSIQNGLWCYAPNSLMRPRPFSIPIEILHLHIQNLFKRCFIDGHQSPFLRPKAKEWYRSLKAIIEDESNIQKCKRVNTHIYDIGHTFSSVCPWCEIEIKSKHRFDHFPLPPNFDNFHDEVTTEIDYLPNHLSKDKFSDSSVVSKILISSAVIIISTSTIVAIFPLLRDQLAVPLIDQIGKIFKK